MATHRAPTCRPAVQKSSLKTCRAVEDSVGSARGGREPSSWCTDFTSEPNTHDLMTGKQMPRPEGGKGTYGDRINHSQGTTSSRGEAPLLVSLRISWCRGLREIHFWVAPRQLGDAALRAAHSCSGEAGQGNDLLMLNGVWRPQREPGCGREAPALTCLQVIPFLEVADEEESWHHNTRVASSINKETEEPEVPPRILQGRGDLFSGSHGREGSQHEGKTKSAERQRGRRWTTGTWPALLRTPGPPGLLPTDRQHPDPTTAMMAACGVGKTLWSSRARARHLCLLLLGVFALACGLRNLNLQDQRGCLNTVVTIWF